MRVGPFKSLSLNFLWRKFGWDCLVYQVIALKVEPRHSGTHMSPLKTPNGVKGNDDRKVACQAIYGSRASLTSHWHPSKQLAVITCNLVLVVVHMVLLVLVLYTTTTESRQHPHSHSSSQTSRPPLSVLEENRLEENSTSCNPVHHQRRPQLPTRVFFSCLAHPFHLCYRSTIDACYDYPHHRDNIG